MTIIHTGNPYTHEEHTRESVNNYPGVRYPTGRCEWCGAAPLILYRYDDGCRMFCNKGCWHSYQS